MEDKTARLENINNCGQKDLEKLNLQKDVYPMIAYISISTLIGLGIAGPVGGTIGSIVGAGAVCMRDHYKENN